LTRHIRATDGATRTVGVKELSRAGRYDNDADLLLRGKLSPRQFRRRWAGKSVDGHWATLVAFTGGLLTLAMVGVSP